MALKVWLPLSNGKFNNYGLNNSQPSGTAFTVDDNGIIGKCIKTNGTAYLTTSFNGNLINTSSISFGGWFKLPKSEIKALLESHTSYSSTNRAASGCLLGNNYYGGISIHWWSNDIYNSGSFSSMTIMSSLRTTTTGLIRTNSWSAQFDTWFHAFLVFNKELGQLKLYINGSLIQSSAVSSFSDATSREILINCGACDGGNSVGSYIPFYTNDIRIYDNALTEDDVKRIYLSKTYEVVVGNNMLFERCGLLTGGTQEYNLTYNPGIIKFNGSNGALKVPFNNLQKGTFSMNVWFFRKEFGPDRWETIFGGPSGFELESKPAASATCDVIAYSWGGNSSSKYIPYTLNEWNMLTMTRTTGNTKFYLNGVLKYTGSAGSIPTGNYFIGAWKDYNNQNFKGNVSKFSIYSKELSASEIKFLYDNEKGYILPDEYEQLEYIQGDKQAYIDTNFVLNSDCSAEAKFCFISAEGASTGNFIMGCRKSYGKLAFNFVGYSGGNKWASNYGSVAGDFGNSDTNIHILKRIKEKVYLDGDLKITTQQSSFTTPGNAYIFSCNQNGTPYLTSNIKLWYLKIWENDLLARNFIPSKRKSDNVIGMYDMVSRQFFTNSGTGSFTGE